MNKIYQLSVIIIFSLISVIAYAIPTTGYQIYIDAGSTGTRLHLYQFTYDPANPSFYPVITERCSIDAPLKKLEGQPSPTLADYAGNSLAVGPGLLKGLLDQAITDHNCLNFQVFKMDEENNTIKFTPQKISVYLLGTAGMRLLVASASSDLYEEAKKYVRSISTNLLLDPKSQQYYLLSIPETNNFTNLDSGKEALYGWLDVNYLMDNFKNNTPTVGSIDQGGASLQIAFETAKKNAENEGDAFTIGGKHYYVFYKSILHFGHVEILNYVKSNLNKLNIDAMTCIPSQGKFDIKHCTDAYDNLMKDRDSDLSSIRSDEHKNDMEKLVFYAYHGIYKTYEYFHVIDNTPPTDAAFHGTFSEAIGGKCEQKKDGQQSAKADEYCANAIFLDRLLYSRLIIGKQLNSINRIKTPEVNQPIDWPLGAVLNGLIMHDQ